MRKAAESSPPTAAADGAALLKSTKDAFLAVREAAKSEICERSRKEAAILTSLILALKQESAAKQARAESKPIRTRIQNAIRKQRGTQTTEEKIAEIRKTRLELDNRFSSYTKLRQQLGCRSKSRPSPEKITLSGSGGNIPNGSAIVDTISKK